MSLKSALTAAVTVDVARLPRTTLNKSDDIGTLNHTDPASATVVVRSR